MMTRNVVANVWWSDFSEKWNGRLMSAGLGGPYLTIDVEQYPSRRAVKEKLSRIAKSLKLKIIYGM